MKTKQEDKPQITRMTNQRLAILQYVKSHKTHPTAEEIYTQVKKNLPRISFGTVYRNLKILKAKGEIRELSIDSKAARFDAITTNHIHFHCRNCDRLIDVNSEIIKKCTQCFKEISPGQIQNYQIEIFGLCSDCSKKLAKK